MSATGDKIRNLRKKQGLTQVQLAERAGLTQGQVSKYERYAEIPAEGLLKIAEALNTSIDYLIGRTDNPEAPVILTERERRLIEALRHLDREPNLDDILKVWLNNQPDNPKLNGGR